MSHVSKQRVTESEVNEKDCKMIVKTLLTMRTEIRALYFPTVLVNKTDSYPSTHPRTHVHILNDI